MIARLLRSLYVRVLIAIALGVIVGTAWPTFAVELKVLGDWFIKLVKITIAPLIFCSVVVGIAGMKSMRAAGKIGGLALLYFELMSTLALVLGLLVVNVVGPGTGMHIDPTKLDPKAVAQYAERGKELGTGGVVDVIRDAFVGAFVRGEILPVLGFAILSGIVLNLIGARGTRVVGGIDRVGKVVFRVIGWIMQLSPLGAFGAMAYTVGQYGVHTLASLAQLMGCFYATCLLFIFGVLGLVARLHGFSIVRFVRYIRAELLIVLGTSSSESALPPLMEKCERLGVSKPVVGLVIPAGYSFNLDGTAIYLTMAAVFIAQATGTPLGLGQQLELLALLLLTSKGAAGVTGSGFVVLAATLGRVGHVPVAGIAIILAIDRFMSEARALTNIIGNGVATIVVARWCRELDRTQLAEQLARGPGD